MAAVEPEDDNMGQDGEQRSSNDTTSDSDENGNGPRSSDNFGILGPSERRIRQLAESLFEWLCQNCTQPNAVKPPNDEMIAFAVAVDKRLTAQRALSMEMARYEQQLEAHKEAVTAREEAMNSALRAAETAADRAAKEGGDAVAVEVDVRSTSAAGVVSHAHVTVTHTAAGQAVATVTSETSEGAVAAPSQAPGAADAPGSAAAPLAPPPVRPDFEAMQAALPLVPYPPPVVSAELLARQKCPMCGVGYIAPSMTHVSVVLVHCYQLALCCTSICSTHTSLSQQTKWHKSTCRCYCIPWLSRRPGSRCTELQLPSNTWPHME
jgi:hypothetical protein